MTKQMILAAAFAACSAFAQDAPPPAPDMPGAPDGQPAPEMRQGPRHRGDGPRRQGPRSDQRELQLRQINPGMMIIGEELVMAKYDTDKDGKLSDEEIAVLQADLQKAQEAKKAAILKKFDKDGDGKLSAEERKAMREEWAKEHPEAAKRMGDMKDRGPRGPRGPEAGDRGRGPRGPMADGPRRQGGPRSEAPRPPRGPEGRQGGEGRRGDGDRGPRGNRPDGPRPQLDPNRAPIMMAGWMLIEEKYDADKDGKLNEAEMTQLKADADKALEARRAARREARKAARGNNAPPPAPAPAEEGE